MEKTMLPAFWIHGWGKRWVVVYESPFWGVCWDGAVSSTWSGRGQDWPRRACSAHPGVYGEWIHGCMGVVGAWVHGCMDAWVHGCMGAWVRGCGGCMGA